MFGLIPISDDKMLLDVILKIQNIMEFNYTQQSKLRVTCVLCA